MVYTSKQRDAVFYSFAFYHFINDAIVFLIPSLMATFYEMFELNFFQTSLIFASNTGMIVIMQFINGNFADHNKEKILYYIGIFSLILSTILIIFSTNFTTLLLFAIFNGFGLGYIHSIIYVSVTKLYSEHREIKIGEMGSWGDGGKLVGIMSSAILLGLGATNWKLILICWAIAASVLAIFSLFFVPKFPFHELHQQDPKQSRSNHLFNFDMITQINSKQSQNGSKEKNFSPVLILILFFTLSFMYSGHFDPLTKPIVLYLHVGRTGFSQLYAPYLYGVLMFFGTVGSFISGRFKKRLGFHRFLTLIYLILIVSMTLFVTINLDNIFFDIFFLAIMGLVTLPIYPSFYSELSFFMNKKRMGLSYGMLMGIGWSGGFVSSLIAGYLADIFGYQMYIVTSIIFAVLALIIVQLIPIRVIKMN